MPKFSKLAYLRLLQNAGLTHAQYRILVTILTYSDRDGMNAHPGFANLAKECKMSKGTVSKGITALKRAGWLWESARGIRGDGSPSASVFELRVPDYFTSARASHRSDPDPWAT